MRGAASPVAIVTLALAACKSPSPSAPAAAPVAGDEAPEISHDRDFARAYAGPPTTRIERDARAFLATVVPLLRPAFTAASEAAWISATDVTDEHTGQRAGAEKVAAALSGSRLVIEQCKALLAHRDRLDELTRRQLEKLLLAAAENPATLPDVVAARVDAEARQSSVQDGFTFCLPGPAVRGQAPGVCARPITANEIDHLLETSRDLAERTAIWNASKEVGGKLKAGLIELRRLRNQVARELGHSSFFGLQVADYDMTSAEMMTLLDSTLHAVQPIYEQLHCHAKHVLAERFAQPPPRGHLPAHWIGNRWAQSWPGIVEGVNLDPLLAGKTPAFIVHTAEAFYQSLGFPKLPDSFWKKSDLYPVEKPSTRKKNTHASAWHVDGELDVRSLMSVEPNGRWFGTAHHELGHIYYYIAYTRPEVPQVLRAGANRAFHEAVGELAKLASEQTPYLQKIGLLPAGKAPKAAAWLLDSAMDSIVFLPFSAGVMSHFEHDLYEKNLPPEAWQDRWWELVAKHQGVVPPAARPPGLCDACTKTHINDDPGQYYDYALATLIKFQLHDHICSKILKEDVRACDYSGHHEVGEFLHGILAAGATRDWRALMRESTGEAVGPRALLAFFKPLLADLAKRNQGRTCTF